MRRSDLVIGVGALLSGVLGASVVGCLGKPAAQGNCDVWWEEGKCGSTGTGGHGTHSGSGGNGGHGGTPKVCPADYATATGKDLDGCGVFVSASAATGGDGSLKAPFQTLEAAAAAGAKDVFVCAETITETKAIKFTGGVRILGHFTDCAAGSWAVDDTKRAQVTTAAPTTGFVLDGGTSDIRNLDVTSPAGAPAGGSSFALVVNGGSLDLTNSTLTSGDATAGDPGTHVDPDTALNGAAGDPGVGVCAAGFDNLGPPGKTNACTATGGSSTGGNGGDGGLLSGTTLLPAGSGSAGSPADTSQPTKGTGGVGEGVGTPPAAGCGDGISGAAGGTGDSGAGAKGGGTLDATGYVGKKGDDGTNGKPGQGGGGGGGAMGATAVTCGTVTSKRVGASGGAGGAGGCGGALGGGGGAGGSSIALVAIGANVTLTQVALKPGKGGDGGVGGAGQTGGIGGNGGLKGEGVAPTQSSCRGGDGGDGGPGGPGGGGQGGHSLGIGFKGTGITAPKGATITPGTKGIGGAGGLNSKAAGGGKGDDGMAADCWDFGANAACS